MFDQNVYKDRVVEKYIMFYNSIMEWREEITIIQSYKKSSVKWVKWHRIFQGLMHAQFSRTLLQFEKDSFVPHKNVGTYDVESQKKSFNCWH